MQIIFIENYHLVQKYVITHMDKLFYFDILSTYSNIQSYEGMECPSRLCDTTEKHGKL